MKKNLLTLCLLLFVLAGVSSRTFFGPKVGLGRNSFWGEDYEDYSSETGFTNDYENSLPSLSAGFCLSIGISDIVFFQPEILFSSKKFNMSWYDNDMSYTFHMVEAPLYFKFIPYTMSGGDRFYLMAGPEFTYLYGNINIETPNHVSVKNTPVADYIDNTLLTGIAVGFGYENLNKDQKNLYFVGFKYARVFTPLNDGKDVYLQSISLELGFLLGNTPKEDRGR